MTDLPERIFISFFNMSVTGSYIILAIILVRLLLKKAPKVFSYSIWIVAGLRLICPFSFSSVLSIFNFFSVPVKESTSGGATVEMNGRRYDVGSGGAKLYNLVAFSWR